MPDLLTFGCRLNLWESEVMGGLARAAGQDDAIIVNSCAVTAEAERQTRQAIRRARREHPGRPIIVTGCAAELAPEAYQAMPEVTRVIRNAVKLDPAAWGLAEAPPQPARFQAHTRGFVQVQQGCDHRCTFCIIPLARGASRSDPVGEVAASVRRLVEAGTREVVLTGVDLTAWGGDLPGRPALGDLVRRLLALVPDLPRLRLSSLDPAEIDGTLWRLIAEEPRLMPHLHLSVQAGDDRILKRMRRRHSRAMVLDVAARARALRPDLALGADLIAGFPTEDGDAFARSLDLVEAAGLAWLHVFPYSARAGTPAARMPPVPGPVIRERAERLRAAGTAAAGRYMMSQIGRTAQVLIERGGTGHSEGFAPVRPVAALAPGQVAPLRLTGIEDGFLRGEAA